MTPFARTSGAAPASIALVDSVPGNAGPRKVDAPGKRLLRLVAGARVGRRDGRLLNALP